MAYECVLAATPVRRLARDFCFAAGTNGAADGLFGTLADTP